jgi:recombinational DNA repair ATPase RecF
MKLTSFQVRDFRSVNDSTPIRVEDGRTVLVGRNESGKSSLLRALHSLRPSSGQLQKWGLARDFPRGRKRSEFREDLVMLETTWSLDESEQLELARIYPRATGVADVRISRSYAPRRIVELASRQTLADLAAPAVAMSAPLSAELATTTTNLPGAEAIQTALNAVVEALNVPADSSTWGAEVLQAVAPLRAALAGAGAGDVGASRLATIEAVAHTVAEDDAKRAAAISWIEQRIPVFVYLDDWDFIPGHYNIPEYLGRLHPNQQKGEHDPLFEKLLKVAELNAQELHGLLGSQHEERKLLTDRAGNVVTATLEQLWKDREITVQFSVDADHFDVIVKDKDSNALVPLDERSRGFRWYFSFFVAFAADTQGGAMDQAILLLDEPGLFLHATAQEALLSFFRTLPNQIVYTTHSPFMVEPRELTSVRTVNLDRKIGTTASGDPTGDANTLFPLQAALGYNLTQTLFIGTDNVVLEGVTDYWYLSAASALLEDAGAGFGKQIVLTPAGGATKVGYMVALLTAQQLNVVVVLDSDRAGDDAAKDLLRSKLIRDGSLVRVGTVLSPRAEADIEDLLEQSVFEDLAREAYQKELKGKTLTLNDKVPRIVRRWEEAFATVGLDFNKTRVAKLFLQKVGGKNAATVFPPSTEQRFKDLISLITNAVDMVKKSNRKPFEN